MSDAYDFGITLQKPMKWGLDQFKSENKRVQPNVVISGESTPETKTSNVALKALRFLGAALAIVFTSPVYALGALLKLIFNPSKEASTTDQVARSTLEKSTSSSISSNVSLTSDSSSKETDARFEALMLDLKDISICKRATIAELESMVETFLNDEKRRDELFVALKKIESEIIDIKANPLIRYDKDKDVKITMDEMKGFFVKHFGIAAYFHRYTCRCIFGYNGVESCAENFASFAALEKRLQSGQEKKDLELVNKLIKADILKLDSEFIFNNGALYLCDSKKKHSISDLLNTIKSRYNKFEVDVFKEHLTESTEKILASL